MNAFHPFILFARAFKNAKRDFYVSSIVLVVVTAILSFIFFIVEHKAQPEEYKHIWDAFVWAITQYIGDPGNFAGPDPITATGRSVATFIGIMEILIFAVPAGLVANGFEKAIKDDRREKHLQECRTKIIKSFRRKLQKSSYTSDRGKMFRIPPLFVSVTTLKAKKFMSEDDVVKTAENFSEFRLVNLSNALANSEFPQDRLVIQLVPTKGKTLDGYDIEETAYGVKINRGSNVTIIAPTSATECSIGFFCFYLAQFGQFNYVSREKVENVDDIVSYFNVKDEKEEHIENFINDIRSLQKSENHWNLVIISSENVHDTQFHFVHKIKKCKEESLATINEDIFQRFYTEFAEDFEEKHKLLSDLDEKYLPLGQKNIGVRLGAGKECNAPTIRISYSITTWTSNLLPIISNMANLIKKHLESDKRKNATIDTSKWNEEGCGLTTQVK